MGYYTDFDIMAEPMNGDLSKDGYAEIWERLEEISDYTFDGYGAGAELYDAKWYDYHKDMTKLSEEFPDVKFTVEGEGEEKGDQWKRYYVAGKYQHANVKIIFDNFDMNKMRKD